VRRTDKQLTAISTQVCRILREQREKQGLSMTALAERAGLTQQAVSYIERGMRTPNLDTLLRIADALGLEPDQLIKKGKRAATRSSK
jgi:transcriptional regulator with XRE-family HTH domain